MQNWQSDDQKLREDMGTAGKKKFEEEFTLSKFEERMGEILSMGWYI